MRGVGRELPPSTGRSHAQAWALNHWAILLASCLFPCLCVPLGYKSILQAGAVFLILSLDPKSTIEVRHTLPLGDCFLVQTNPTCSLPVQERSKSQVTFKAGAHLLL